VVDETSLGKIKVFLPNPAASTFMRIVTYLGFAMMCLLTLPQMPLMQFLFVSSGFCSPAYFRPVVAHSALAAY
jgi:hypothetical protein